MTKVSVCMAVYNGEKYVQKQLISILIQLNSNDEIIISDDGSTDSTLQVIKSFKDNRIKIFVNNRKKGPVGNFENAIAHAKGNIIFLSDQDDIWFENKMQKHLELHRNYDLIVSNAVVTDKNNRIIFNSFFKERNSRSGLINNLVKNSYIGCCMSFTTNIANQALPFPSNLHMHDWWIGLIGEIIGKTYFYNEPLMNYIRHDNNASGTLQKQLPIKQQLFNRLNLLYSLGLFLIKKK